jgi:hypothetical protein
MNQMKKPLLKAFYAFIIMMLSLSTTKAQIVFTDLNPDILRNCNPNSGCSGNYSLDFNNDGINDFVLSPEKRQRSCGACSSLILQIRDGYAAEIISTDHSWIADTIGGYALNAVIDSTLGWTNADHTLSSALPACVACTTFPGHGHHFEGSTTSGPWSNIQGKYLALKTQVGTDFYYGWIKLGVANNINFVTITVMEYAYNAIPNEPILAGQTMTTGIRETTFASSINLFPNPADNHLTIDFGSKNEEVKVTIADITGKVVYRTIATDTQRVDVNTNDFAKGIYVVQIQGKDFIAAKKLVIEK